MSNHLAHETSPYLLQHAENPVDWYPWGDEALERARRENKPILLSIGYSACHWCHVMAHESFEDPAVAAAMNEHFINIKVDREERPDLDQIYQTAHAVLTQRSGGWPLTMFLTPDQQPFFGGTYFPKQSRHNLPGFLDLVPRIAAIYREKRDDIERQNLALAGALSRTVPQLRDTPQITAAPLADARRELGRSFDPKYGGIGNAPKFPHPFELDFCLARHALDDDADVLNIVRVTLTRMAEGGIYDQLGGGFCRYSVDQYWTIPHFEKMLYDNGPLLALYSDAWRVTHDALYENVAVETANWAMREMQSPQGGFYSSLDADSEHEEGKFYVWTPDEVQALLTPDEYAVVAPHYGLDGPPNFEQNRWHLRVVKPLAFIAGRLDIAADACAARLESARAKLLAAREQRVHPGRDDKVLASWNALMIKGLTRAARVFGRAEWLAAADRALSFIRGTMWRDGRLLATSKDGRSHLNAYLDDYAFLLDAMIERLQASFRSEDLEFACALADTLLAQFEDTDEGGFFFTSHDHEQLIHRPKTAYDNATPSGNGVAATALQRLGHLTGEQRYLAATERAIQLFYPVLQQQAGACVSLITALAEYLAPPPVATLRGPADELSSWQRALDREYRPNLLTLAIPDTVSDLPEVLDKPVNSAGGPVNAWVCRGTVCLPPVDSQAELRKALAQ
jgi:uncharacterized protein YyaL (SSP411 family)